ncbi:MAG: hypothetical protein R3A47_04240 [Polyangiales bacterium]
MLEAAFFAERGVRFTFDCAGSTSIPEAFRVGESRQTIASRFRSDLECTHQWNTLNDGDVSFAPMSTDNLKEEAFVSIDSDSTSMQKWVSAAHWCMSLGAV